MSTAQKLSRVICDKCSHVFNIGEAGIKHNKYYGIDIAEKVCPECGGTFRIIDLPRELDQYLYVNEDERYYIYLHKGKN